MKDDPRGKRYSTVLKTAVVGIAVVVLLGAVSLLTPGGKAVAATITNVLITNTANNPVNARDVDNAASQPFQWNSHFQFDPSQLGASASFTVPAHKRLVIEFVSELMGTSQGKIVVAGMDTTVSGHTVAHHLLITEQGAGGGYPDSFIASETLRLYADPGTTATVEALRELGGSGEVFATVSGYYINVP